MQISFYSPTHGGFREWEGHEVKNNETMVGIALKYDITVEDIRRCNNLWTNDALWPGQVIFFLLKIILSVIKNLFPMQCNFIS